MEIFSKPETTQKRQRLRNNMTKPEQVLWQYIRKEQLGVKFRRQHGIGEYIVDFYCAEKKLVIEIDGDTHFTESGIEYDKIRTGFINSLGIRVTRFTNNDVMTNIEEVLNRIKNNFGA